VCVAAVRYTRGGSGAHGGPQPTAGLSPAETASVVELVQRLPRDVTILLIEHDMDVALELAERVTVLHYGWVVADGPTEAVRRDPRVTEIYLGTSDA
jgi:branched-chain amino acid transport system ATP-binding protein